MIHSANVNARYTQFSKIVASSMMKLMLTSEPTQKVLEELLSDV